MVNTTDIRFVNTRVNLFEAQQTLDLNELIADFLIQLLGILNSLFIRMI